MGACMRVRACGGVCTYVFCLELTRNKKSVISHFNIISSDNRMYISGNVGLWDKFEVFSYFSPQKVRVTKTALVLRKKGMFIKEQTK